MAFDDDSEEPLDPAAERLRRKLARLLFVSGGIMMLGLIAVFAAIVYRVGALGNDEAAPAAFAAPVEAAIDIPAGARIVSAELDGERALLTLQDADGATSLLLVDLATGRTLGRYSLRPE